MLVSKDTLMAKSMTEADIEKLFNESCDNIIEIDDRRYLVGTEDALATQFRDYVEENLEMFSPETFVQFCRLDKEMIAPLARLMSEMGYKANELLMTLIDGAPNGGIDNFIEDLRLEGFERSNMFTDEEVDEFTVGQYVLIPEEPSEFVENK